MTSHTVPKLLAGLCGALLIAAMGGAVRTSDASAAGTVPVHTQLLAPGKAPAGSAFLGLAPSTLQVPLRFVLHPSQEARLTSLLPRLYDPASVQYHHWLPRGQFEANFGPTETALSTVTSWVRSQGLTSSRATTFSLQVTATAGQVSTALGTTIGQYRDAAGQLGYVADSAPVLPQSVLDAGVVSILGLNSFAHASPALEGPSSGAARLNGARPRAVHANVNGPIPCSAASSFASNRYYTMNQLGTAYGLGSLFAAGQNGRSQTVAAYELAPVSASDLAAYQGCFGLSNPASRATVDGGGTISQGGTVEADLDLEQIATQAPGSSLISYEGPNTGQGQYDTWNSIVTADAASVVSTSWGSCEPLAFQYGWISAYGPLFQQAAAQGQTIVAASADSGSEDCYRAAQATALETDYPASDPWVTGIGGTTLSNTEVAWNQCEGQVGVSCAAYGGGSGGGGLSRYIPRPSWQPATTQWVGSGNPCGVDCRQVPDISANAAVDEVVFANGAWEAVGGTSAAAPLLAGVVADKNQACAASTGDFAPSLYALASQSVYGTALTDITSGDNDLTRTYSGAYFAARQGYDLATGLGSPLAAGLSCAEVSSVVPRTAPAGTQVTVYGLGLERASISFGGAAAPVVTASATQATVTVPSGAGQVVVVASSVLGAGTTTSAFSYQAAITLTSSVNPSSPGQPITFTATLSPSAATGTVTFADGGQALATAQASGGVATFTTSSLVWGRHAITASYGGDGSYAGSTSPVLLQTVGLVYGITMDGYGGLHPYGNGTADTAGASYWPGWTIARGEAEIPGGSGGYTLDGWGGLHPFGSAPAVTGTGHWQGWDIARGIVLNPCDATGHSGYVLDGLGGVHQFGAGAPAVTVTGYWPNWDIAKGLAVNPCAAGVVTGYVLDGLGGVHGFSGGGPIATPATTAYWPSWVIARGIAVSGTGQGYVLDGLGGLHPFGGAAGISGSAYWPNWDIGRGITYDNRLGGGYVLDGWGALHPFGNAPPATPSGFWPGWDIARSVSTG